MFLVENQSASYVREWLFLGYAAFVLGEGLGLYYLTRPVGSMALWALVVFSAGILVGIVQDAALVAFVGQFPTDYAGADTTTRSALEPVARTFGAIIGVQQAVANILLGFGVALYALAVLRTGVASRWFGLFGLASAAASVSVWYRHCDGSAFQRLRAPCRATLRVRRALGSMGGVRHAANPEGYSAAG